MTAIAEPTWPGLLTELLAGRDLSVDGATWVMEQVLRGQADPARVAGFLVALRAKGATFSEVEGLVAAMERHAVPVAVEGPTVDIVGTGGDHANTVNISTMAAIVAAGAGARVVKHGNRAASSACGSADLLEALGVTLDLSAEQTARSVREAGIAFCFAPLFHPAMKHAAATRRALGVPTVFNLLGPLTNPARPQAQAVGVADPATGPLLAGVLARRGTAAVVFHGDDGLDELTVTSTSTVWTVTGGQVRREQLEPLDLGIPRAALEDLRGGGPAHNAGVARSLLSGADGPIRDAVLLSAAATLAVTDPADTAAKPITERLAAHLPSAAAAIDSGAAAALLERWVTTTRVLATPLVPTT
ncbi:anthranilate phosphoribosyltransferase [Streptomyces sp. NBC_01304]|uniref:anthranilate phosphoribosyltransferase n=1 Tax=Streptomyces sp. NBC_01304 TaxID=2903818 RepID=UPI002E122A35|nr:anthranilate phosphoribosyltransferase [Streptomyces sp. NBC_01304]